MERYGCLDCLSLADEERIFETDGTKPYYCPYCGNQGFIEVGPEWYELMEERVCD